MNDEALKTGANRENGEKPQAARWRSDALPYDFAPHDFANSSPLRSFPAAKNGNPARTTAGGLWQNHGGLPTLVQRRFLQSQRDCIIQPSVGPIPRGPTLGCHKEGSNPEMVAYQRLMEEIQPFQAMITKSGWI
jgi:hypothetical protein